MYVFQTNLSRTNWWPCYLMKSPSCDYYWTSQMISQHWYWRQQAFTWADHDQVLCRHMQSLGPNGLSASLLTTSPDSYVVPIVRIGLGENWSVISASKWAHVIFFQPVYHCPHQDIQRTLSHLGSFPENLGLYHISHFTYTCHAHSVKTFELQF